MVKGLLIRQVLTAVNLLIAFSLAYIIYLIGAQQLAKPYTPISIPAADPNASERQLAKVGARSDYDVVVNGGMFGANANPAAPPENPEPVAPPTVQNTILKLFGTVASWPTDPLATAIIENPTPSTPNAISTYYLGQEVMDNLVLKEVHRRRVILYNKAKNQNEELVMGVDVAALPAKNAKDARLGGRNAAAAGAGSHVTLDRAAVMEELNSMDTAELLNQLNPELVTDEKGNVTGITSATLSNIPVAQQAGLQNNDVIQSVNGVQIDSEQKLGEIAQKFQNANTFRISILRDNKPQMLTFKLE